jgi:hypothetical protein
MWITQVLGGIVRENALQLITTVPELHELKLWHSFCSVRGSVDEFLVVNGSQKARV